MCCSGLAPSQRGREGWLARTHSAGSGLGQIVAVHGVGPVQHLARGEAGVAQHAPHGSLVGGGQGRGGCSAALADDASCAALPAVPNAVQGGAGQPPSGRQACTHLADAHGAQPRGVGGAHPGGQAAVDGEAVCRGQGGEGAESD